MGIEMKIIFLQNLTGGLFGGILKGLLKNRLNGLFARTPTIAVLLLTAVIAACASSSKSNDSSTADCTFAEDVGGTIDCANLLTLTQFNTTTTYNITIGEIGKEGATDKLGLGNFTFTEIVNRNPSDPNSGSVFRSVNPLTLSINATALNITISGIDKDLFGNFYIDLDLALVDNVAAAVAVKVRYTISITSVNDAPVFVRGNSPGVQFDSANGARNASYGFAGIPFNSTAGYSVGNVSVADIDNDTISYRIIGGADDIALFQINPTTGEITLKAIAANDGNLPIPYTFNVTASDGKGGSTIAVINVRVLPDGSAPDTNQPPVFEEGNSPGVQFTPAVDATPARYTFANISHNSDIGDLIGNVSATDPDGDDEAITYSIDGRADDDTLFTINSTTGVITLGAVATNDGNLSISYTFNVIARDDRGTNATATISVRVLPNEAPMFEEGNSPGVQFTPAVDATPARYTFANISHNSDIGDLIGNVSANDPDGDDEAITYSIDGRADDDTLFTINSTTGVITLGAVATNDGNLSISYTFNVTANDGNGGITTATISVRVLPNEAPVFRAVVGSESQFIAVRSDIGLPRYSFDGIPINSIMGYSVGNVLATDANNDDITYSISNMYLIDEGSSDFEINTLFTINSTTGEVTLSATADAGDSGMYQVNATATDEQGANATATISVYVDNTAPMLEGMTPYEFSLSLSDARARGVVVGNVSATDEQRTLFDYSLVNNGDLFERAPDKNIDGSINIILSRAATLSDFAVSSITFQVVVTHQGDGMSTNADVTVNLNNDLPLDDDLDGDRVQGFYDAFPHDATMNVMGDGEPGNPFIISNIYQLQAVAGVDHEGMPLSSSDFTNNGFLYGDDAADQLTKHYELANNINASDTDNTDWIKPEVEGYIGQGWTPIAGKSSQSFSGSFNGEGYAINSLEIIARQGVNSKHFGLFGINNGNITAVGLQNINMTIQAEGNNYLGTTTVDTIVDGSHAGGLVALNQEDGNITYSYTTGLANGSMDAMGGLVGLNQGKISYSYSTATVQGEGDTGGLVGTNQGGALLSSYATGNVRGSIGIFGRGGTAGGLAGSISGAGAIISASYAAGIVSDKGGDGGSSLGGVIGERNQTAGNGVTIESSYWNSAATPLLPGVGKSRVDPSQDGIITGTTGLTIAQLEGCELDGAVISGVTDPTCTIDTVALFPSVNWGDDTTDGITRNWIFNADEYPSLRVIRSSDTKDLLPSAADQECHRNSMSSGC